jgi:predicted  nucleic acid-binding Zn-ribbon protein
VSDLEPLLTLQEHDLALDRLRHRLATLAERELVETGEERAKGLRGTVAEVSDTRDETAGEEARFDGEARALGEQAAAVEARLYSGEVSSPRELQAMQKDVEQLKRHQRSVEDKQLATMERREPLDEQVAALESELAACDAELEQARQALAASEAEIDAEITTEAAARATIAAAIDPALIAAYERCRDKAGIGAARLVGMTCQACHLSIPATEVDRIRKASSSSTIEHCDNCGAILIA